VRIGNWLTAEQGIRLLTVFDIGSIRGKRDYAMVATLLGCGLRRAELAGLMVRDLQQREEHWIIADLIGKGGHIRTVPVPSWVKTGVDADSVRMADDTLATFLDVPKHKMAL
jgi:site-specific recombinase XerD